MSKIRIQQIEKNYGKIKALVDFSFESNENEFVIVVGPSGCGKSTLLNIIAGLEKPTKGSIILNGNDITKAQPNERNTSIVFQNYALYPNLTVYENLAFPLSVRKYNKATIRTLVEDVAKKLEISEFLNRKPKSLSGGQKQRVAIGRAMIRNPSVFLLDEPLSNLDASLREKMREELIKLHNAVDAVFIYVTHDQIEALSMADRIIILNEGIIQQIGTPDEVYNSPDNLFVAKFIGSPKINIISADIYNSLFSPKVMYCPIGLSVGIRPESISLYPECNEYNGIISLVEMLGSEFSVHVQIGDENIIVSIPANLYHTAYKCGCKVKCVVDEKKVLFFDLSSGKRVISTKKSHIDG